MLPERQRITWVVPLHLMAGPRMNLQTVAPHPLGDRTNREIG